MEFCCGLTIDGDELLLSYGIWDTEAKLLKIKAQTFLDLVGLEKWIPAR